MLLDLIGIIEIAFRTHIAYLLAHKYGPLGYLDENNFLNAKLHQGFKEELERKLRKSKDKKKIALDYYETSAYIYIESWLRTIAFVRNVSAHYGRLYNKNIVIQPKLYREDKQNRIAPDKLFSAIWVRKQLITDKGQWRSFVLNLSALIEEYTVVNLEQLGFPVN